MKKKQYDNNKSDHGNNPEHVGEYDEDMSDCSDVQSTRIGEDFPPWDGWGVAAVPEADKKDTTKNEK